MYFTRYRWICRELRAYATVVVVICLPLVRSAGTGDMLPLEPSEQEAQIEQVHQLDSLNLLVFVSLLILTILTIWLFKRHQRRFIHETGLAILYGLIVGAIINYTIPRKQLTTMDCTYNMSEFAGGPPYLVKLRASPTIDENMTNGTTQSDVSYIYRLQSLDTKNQVSSEPELETKATFDPEVFFNVILPPIIFNAGYHMKRRHFFKNFGAIITYAFAGTTISVFTVGGLMYGFVKMINLSMQFTDCLLFGAIISATDPVTVLAIFNDLNVDVDLYALVFGESVLNDAVAIVLVSSIEKYSGSKASGFDMIVALKCLGEFLGVFCGAFAMGSSMGCVTALLTKYTHLRDFPLLETSLFVLMSYATFLAAEAAHLTGIVAVLFCGICQAHYTYNNLSVESKARTKELFELMNFLMENFVFTYIGVSMFTFTHHSWHAGFIVFAFVAVIISRFCNIYPLSFLLNLGRSRKINLSFQHMMMFSGLRGAMAFALAIRNTSTQPRQIILSTTLIIVIATVILCGGFTTYILQWLKISVGVEDERQMQNFAAVRNDATNDNVANAETSSSASRLHDKARLVRVWYNIDRRFVKPLLTHTKPPLTETLPACCLPLARLLTTTEQLTNTDSHADDADSVCILNDDEIAIIGTAETNNVFVPDVSVPQHLTLDQSNEV